jgi:hypothetical protein
MNEQTNASSPQEEETAPANGLRTVFLFKIRSSSLT